MTKVRKSGATDAEIVAAYSDLKSTPKVAARLQLGTATVSGSYHFDKTWHKG